MKLWIKLSIAFALVAAGVGVWVWWSRRQTNSTALGPSTHAWALSDALQGTQIQSLADQTKNFVSKDDVLSLISGLQPSVTQTTIVRLPEFRRQNDEIQWRYTDENDWHSLGSVGTGTGITNLDTADTTIDLSTRFTTSFTS